jgi:hypothetical protein
LTVMLHRGFVYESRGAGMCINVDKLGAIGSRVTKKKAYSIMQPHDNHFVKLTYPATWPGMEAKWPRCMTWPWKPPRPHQITACTRRSSKRKARHL